MRTTFDQNLFTQIGLDSGSLTMLASVVHTFPEPGEYRGAVHLGEKVESVFYIKADKNSPVAQVNIDLGSLTASPTTAPSADCCCDEGNKKTGSAFVVNPKGYAVFHVSSGAGGCYVHVRKADEDPKQKIFDSRKLEEGDIYSAVILRPGCYSVTNTLTRVAAGELIVHYPSVGKTGYRPPPAVRIEVGENGFQPNRIEVYPGQGLSFHFKQPSRIKIELVKPDDGPKAGGESFRAGWKKTSLPRPAQAKPKSKS
jgi:hypothetical protein